MKHPRKIVMISSTVIDLPTHRVELRDGCERAGFEPHMMEKLPARDADAVKASEQLVDEADVYVGVFAYRYGYVPTGLNISITEMEYNRAEQRKIPRLIFLIHENHPITKKDVETGPGERKLQTLKNRLSQQRVVAFFQSPKDLRSLVVEALTTLRDEFDNIGHNDVSVRAAKTLHRKTSIPVPPEAYVAHPYTLLQLHELVGRQTELNTLTEWIADPTAQQFGAPVLCSVAIGGVGKSALAWKWFREIAPNEMKPLTGRLWWSFYESDATFENFVNRALCYVAGHSEDEASRLPWPEREAQLLRHLDEDSFLFVLDGLERILVAYHRADASYLADDLTDTKGKPQGNPPIVPHRLRQTTDARAGIFLQKLTMVRKSRILITTRLLPLALQTLNLDIRPGCSAHVLSGLADDDALALWRALGVSGSRAELLPIFRSVENHPLLVQALASEVANYRAAPRDFAAWRSANSAFDPTRLDLKQSRTHILDFALRGLTDDVREVLHTIAGFRMPASYATLEALLIGKGKVCQSPAHLDRSLAELEDRGLIGWDRDANRYDAHPIVRGVVWQLTDADRKRAVYSALHAHFEPMATPEWRRVDKLADLSPAIERYHTLIGLGRFDDAFVLFRDRLDYATLYRLAAHRERIAWLEPLLSESAGGVPRLTDRHSQSYALNALGASLHFSGQTHLAVPLLQRAVAIDEERGEKTEAQTSLSNLGDALREIGAFRKAMEAVLGGLVMAREATRSHLEAAPLVYLGRLFIHMGDRALSHIAIDRCRRIRVAEGNRQGEGFATAILAERSLWLGDLSRAHAFADKAWDLANDQKYERDIIRATLLQGQIALAQGDLSRAEERLNHALYRARTVNVVEFELPCIVAMSEIDLRCRGSSNARSRLGELWEAAERGPYPIAQANAYNVLAAVHRAEGKKSDAIAAATKAYTTAWCDGPPYAYVAGLKKARAHLISLEAPNPDLPIFDKRSVPALPRIEINRRDEYYVDPAVVDDGTSSVWRLARRLGLPTPVKPSLGSIS